ncbi:hypothetical protein WMF39_45785 [Sorangium sp. So ce1504]
MRVPRRIGNAVLLPEFAIFGGYVAMPSPFVVTLPQHFSQDSLF